MTPPKSAIVVHRSGDRPDRSELGKKGERGKGHHKRKKKKKKKIFGTATMRQEISCRAIQTTHKGVKEMMNEGGGRPRRPAQKVHI